MIICKTKIRDNTIPILFFFLWYVDVKNIKILDVKTNKKKYLQFQFSAHTVLAGIMCALVFFSLSNLYAKIKAQSTNLPPVNTHSLAF